MSRIGKTPITVPSGVDVAIKDGTVTVKVNDKELVNYKTEPATTKLKPDGGTIAFQAHDKGSTTFYKNIRIKVLK